MWPHFSFGHPPLWGSRQSGSNLHLTFGGRSVPLPISQTPWGWGWGILTFPSSLDTQFLLPVNKLNLHSISQATCLIIFSHMAALHFGHCQFPNSFTPSPKYHVSNRRQHPNNDTITLFTITTTVMVHAESRYIWSHFQQTDVCRVYLNSPEKSLKIEY